MSQEAIPRSISDTYLTGLYIDRNSTDTVYYTTQMGIHSYDQATKGTCMCVYVCVCARACVCTVYCMYTYLWCEEQT